MTKCSAMHVDLYINGSKVEGLVKDTQIRIDEAHELSKHSQFSHPCSSNLKLDFTITPNEARRIIDLIGETT